MCLILLAYDAHPIYRLILAANRDEFYDRPTASADYWEDAPHILAGRDLKDGGAWLGITRNGEIAALTNFRGPGPERRDAPSRGRLVSGFLNGNGSVEEYLETLRCEGKSYNGFNLIFGDPGRLCWYCNRHKREWFLAAGIHGLSNALLDSPWPKVSRGKEALARIIAEGRAIEEDRLLAILADRTVPPDGELPDTGVGIELERLLSPIFISSPTYGTRSSTVVLIGHDGVVRFAERSFNGHRENLTEKRWCFTIDRGAWRA
jgi:uncharacterized protein with NRDE domain